jgi:RNA recognition motif-containing protein
VPAPGNACLILRLELLSAVVSFSPNLRFLFEVFEMKLHVTNLSPKITNNDLRSLFGKYGFLLGSEIEWNQKAGRTSGTAIIEMDYTGAQNAIRALNGRAFRNRRLYITPIVDSVSSFSDNASPEPKTATF